MKTLEELINREDPGMPLVRAWADKAACKVDILPCDRSAGERAVVAMQVTTRSPMGAICYETGGILVDDGWLRILGAGCERLPRSMPEWNHGRVPQTDGRPEYVVVGDDVLGGSFALNGGGLEGIPPGVIAYFAPDALEWESLNMSYSSFLQWCWSGALNEFYADCRWDGWRDETKALKGDQAFSVYPFLCVKGPHISQRSRRAVPASEIWGIMHDGVHP